MMACTVQSSFEQGLKLKLMYPDPVFYSSEETAASGEDSATSSDSCIQSILDTVASRTRKDADVWTTLGMENVFCMNGEDLDYCDQTDYEPENLRKAFSEPGRMNVSKRQPIDYSKVTKNTFVHLQVPEVEVPLRRTASAPGVLAPVALNVAIIADLHQKNLCRPCAYFCLKEDGCRQGPECKFCHLCSVKDMKRRKKERSKAARAYWNTQRMQMVL